MEEETRRQLKEIIANSRRVTFLGGAGVSTDSGLLDFRSPQGLYNVQSEYGEPYEVMLSHEYFEYETKTFYDFYWKYMVDLKAKPNKAHYALAEFEKTHPNFTLVTQNIDGLHQRAGSKRVLEAHGSILHYHCTVCGKGYELDDIPHEGVPHCSCGGILKPDVVLYGEGLDNDVIMSSIEAVRRSDVLIIGGTSMRVYPVAAFPDYFLSGTKIIINNEATPYDAHCDYVIHENIGDVLQEILN